MNEMLKLGLNLMIVALLAGAALSLTNQFTQIQIEKQRQAALKESVGKVISEAESFKEVDSHYEAYNNQGVLIGKVFKVASSGYSSIINALVGVDLENKIVGVEIVSQQETPGLGTNIAKESFLQQFIGKSAGDLKIKKDGGKIDAITGATISSRAITNGIRAAIEGNIPLGKSDSYSSADVTTSPTPSNNTNTTNENAAE